MSVFVVFACLDVLTQIAVAPGARSVTVQTVPPVLTNPKFPVIERVAPSVLVHCVQSTSSHGAKTQTIPVVVILGRNGLCRPEDTGLDIREALCLSRLNQRK